MPWKITTTRELAIQLASDNGDVRTIKLLNPKSAQYVNKNAVAAALEPLLQTKAYAAGLSSDTEYAATFFSDRDSYSGKSINYTKVNGVTVTEKTVEKWYDPD